MSIDTIALMPPINSPLIGSNNYMTNVWYQFFRNFARTDLTAPTANGLLAFDGTHILSRTLMPGSTKLSILNGSGVAANPVLDVVESVINHNNLLNYVANKHIDHSTVSVIAGTGLTGGGPITSSVTLNANVAAFDYTSLSSKTYLYKTDLFAIADSQSAYTIKKITVQDFRDSVWHVKDFGATGNGSTDDTAAIQAAIDFAVASGGGTVLFGLGSYILSSTLTLGSYTHLEGVSSIGCYLFGPTNTDVILINGIGFNTIKNLYIIPNGTKTAGSGIKVQHPTTDVGYFRLYNLVIQSHMIGVDIVTARAYEIENCVITDNLTNQIKIQNTYAPDNGDFNIVHNILTTASSTGPAVYYLSGGGGKFSYNKIGGHTYGIVLEPSAGVSTGDLMISNNSIENQTTGYILIDDPSGATTFLQTQIINNQFGGLTGAGKGIEINGAIFTDVMINDNIIVVNTGSAATIGIKITNSDVGNISGNILYGSGVETGINISGAGVTEYSIGLNTFHNLATNVADTGTNTQIGVTTTGLAAQGDLLYGSASNVYTRLAKDTNSTRYLSNQGTSNNPSWNQVNLANGVTGTLPLANGGTGVTALPKFKAYVGTNQTIADNTNVKVKLDTETFDSNSNFDSTTNYRFTPTVAGDYRISASILMTLGAATTKIAWLGIFKNGSEYSRSTIQRTFIANDIYNLTTTDIVNMNGSTDYVEIYTFQNTGSSVTITSGSNLSYASGECLLS